MRPYLGISVYLHPANLEAECCLSGAGVFGFALVDVALVCRGVPCSEAQLDVYYAWVPIPLCHILQLQQRYVVNLYHTNCALRLQAIN